MSTFSKQEPKINRDKNKKAALSQGNRAMPQLFIVFSSLPTFTTSLRVAKLRKTGFTTVDIPA